LNKNVQIGQNEPLLNFLEESQNLKISEKSEEQVENNFDVSKIKITK